MCLYLEKTRLFRGASDNPSPSQNDDDHREPLILVVDDSSDGRDMLAEYVTVRWFSVVEAANGESAIDLVHKHRPAVILMDLQMPGIGGRMKENGRMSTPRRRRTDREPVTHRVGMPAVVPSASGDIPNAVADFSIEPIQEDIARRAYQLYEERGGEHGRDQEDWFQAEREVRQFLQDAVGKFLAAESPYAAV